MFEVLNTNKIIIILKINAGFSSNDICIGLSVEEYNCVLSIGLITEIIRTNFN